jgi:hypothetical protein
LKTFTSPEILVEHSYVPERKITSGFAFLASTPFDEPAFKASDRVGREQSRGAETRKGRRWVLRYKKVGAKIAGVTSNCR